MKENQFKTVCLCGSTRFKEACLFSARSETFAGNIVLMSPVFGHADNEKFSPKQVDDLDRIHHEKIRMCDEVLVVNRFGYVGKSTQQEIEFALEQKKKVRFLEPDGFHQDLSELTDNEIWFALTHSGLTNRTQEVSDLIRDLHDRHIFESVTERFHEVDNRDIRLHFCSVDANMDAEALVNEYEEKQYEDNMELSVEDEIRVIEARALMHSTYPALGLGLEAPEEFTSEWFVVSKEFASAAKKFDEFIDTSSMGYIWGRRPCRSSVGYGRNAYVEPAIVPVLKQLA